MGNVDGKEDELRFFCPYCTYEVTPETTQCSNCGYVYGPDTLDLLTSPSEKPPYKDPNERRKQVRVHKTFKIAYRTPNAFINNYLSDIGIGGLFVKTDAPQNAGEKFNLKIFLPDEQKALEVFCEVAWVREEERVTPKGKLPAGMGLKFVNPPKEVIDKILGILRQSLS